MHQTFADILLLVTLVIEAVGVGVIAGGIVLATLALARRWLRDGSREELYPWYRARLGRAILLGLEFLVAADIVETVAVRPTFRSLAVLGLIVLIRTFLSFSLEAEIEGRWPWQAEARRAS